MLEGVLDLQLQLISCADVRGEDHLMPVPVVELEHGPVGDQEGPPEKGGCCRQKNQRLKGVAFSLCFHCAVSERKEPSGACGLSARTAPSGSQKCRDVLT